MNILSILLVNTEGFDGRNHYITTGIHKYIDRHDTLIANYIFLVMLDWMFWRPKYWWIQLVYSFNRLTLVKGKNCCRRNIDNSKIIPGICLCFYCKSILSSAFKRCIETRSWVTNYHKEYCLSHVNCYGNFENVISRQKFHIIYVESITSYIACLRSSMVKTLINKLEHCIRLMVDYKISRSVFTIIFVNIATSDGCHDITFS